MPSKTNTLSADQQKLMEIISQASAALAALSVAAPASSVKKVRKTKSTSSADAESVEKKPLNPKIAAMNVERMAIFQEMKSAWLSANPSAATLEWGSKELKERVKKGEFPPLPTYPQALKEHSRRRGEADPEQAAKSKARRDALDAKQAEGAKKKVFKVKALAPAPSKPEPVVSTVFETEDAEEFNLQLQIGEEKFLMNGENWVLDSEQTWVGLWNPETKELDRSAPEPSE
jgi:hypothetical protein